MRAITPLVVAAIIVVAASPSEGQLGHKQKGTKIAGSPLGYRSLHKPFSVWKSQSAEKRWTGKLSETIIWDDVEQIRVIYQQIHIRDNEQIDTWIRTSLDDSVLIADLPDDARADRYTDRLQLQALLELKGGDTALLSICASGNPVRYSQWTIVERRRNGIGLALQEQK